MVLISVEVNGTRRQHEVEPRLLLVQYLRETLGPHGYEHRVRYQLVRRLHRVAQRGVGQVVHAAGGPGR